MTQSVKTRPSEPAEASMDRFQPPTLRGLIMANKRVSGAILAVLVALLAIVLMSDLTNRVSRVTDSTPCSVWSSANQRERDAYATLYVKEHGALPSGAIDAPTIEGVIDNACTNSYGFDEADTVTVLQAVRQQF